MTTTTTPAAPANDTTPPPTSPAEKRMASWDIQRMCADEIGAPPEAIELCKINARIGHLMSDLLSPEEKERLASLDRKAAEHLRSIDDAISMPASRVAAAKDLIECGAVPSEKDFEEFELARARRTDRIKICKMAAQSFYHQDVLPFAREICLRAAGRLKTINEARAREERATGVHSASDADIIGGAQPLIWQPSQVLLAIAKLRWRLLLGEFQVNLASPSSLLRGCGLEEIFG
jgi:hypothetical protein